MTRSALLTIAVLAVAASRQELSAQAPSVAGVVRDSAGRPIPFAVVSIGALHTRTDSVGHFYLSFAKRDSVTVVIRRLGYARMTFSLSADEAVGNDLDVVLNLLPFALDEVTVEDPSFRHMTPLAGFDERRARGGGIFLTQDDIARRNTDRLSHILRGEPGVIIMRGRDGRESLRFARAKRGCMPQYWVDNQRVREFDINDIARSVHPRTDADVWHRGDLVQTADSTETLMLTFLKLLRSLAKTLHSDGSPGQIAAGIALGAALGLTPIANVHNVVVLLLLAVLNVSFAAGLLAWGVFVPVGFMLDPLFDRVGHWLLVDTQGLRPLWTAMDNIPGLALTNFNNSIVLGSVVLWVLLFVPLYFAARFGVVRYRATIGERVRQSRFYKALEASQLYNVYTWFRP